MRVDDVAPFLDVLVRARVVAALGVIQRHRAVNGDGFERAERAAPCPCKSPRATWPASA